MNVLVTGATGFLGRYIVRALLDAGHHVRAVVRPGRDVKDMHWPDSVDVHRADLSAKDDLAPAMDGIDAVMHLATPLFSGDDERHRVAVDGTQCLIDAMVAAKVKRLVHASSFSVYDWRRVGDALSEQSPLLTDFYYDGYSRAKLEQEHLVRGLAAKHDLAVTILRPGMIWGPGRMDSFFLGGSKPLWLIVAPNAQVKHTYVENCADAFVKSLGDAAVGQTFNMVDDIPLTASRFAREYAACSSKRALRVPVPYGLGHATAAFFTAVNAIFAGKLPLPSFLNVRRFERRFKHVRCPIDHLKKTLNWQPPYSFEQAMDRVFGGDADEVGQPRAEATA